MQDEVYCLIGATESRMRAEAGSCQVFASRVTRVIECERLFRADRMDYEFELDIEECYQQGLARGMRLALVSC